MMDDDLIKTVARAIWRDAEWERLSDEYGGVSFDEVWSRQRYLGIKDRLLIAARAAIETVREHDAAIKAG